MFLNKNEKQEEGIDIITKSNEQANYLIEAKKAASIIDVGLKEHSLSDMNDELAKLSSYKDNKIKYVFKGYNYAPAYVVICLCIILEILFLVSLVIGLGTLIYSSTYRVYGIIGFSFSFLIILFNTYLVKHSISKIRFLKRYNRYEEILNYHSIELIDVLAEQADVLPSVVVKDIKIAIKSKLIPQGHIGRDDLIVMISDDIYNKYKEKQAVYDRYYRKLLEERARVKGRSEEIKKIMETGRKYIDKIHASKDIIKDKEISRKLEQMEKMVSWIFYEVDLNPTNTDKLGVFLNYYLPTTEKLLEAYIDIDQNERQKVTIKRLKNEIEVAIDFLNQSFEGILNMFYKEQEMDLLSDISAMEIMMKQEGIASYDNFTRM